MSKKIGKVKKEKTRSNAGPFWGGTFFGFFMCLLILFGFGSFVYFKVSPRWINKTFKTNIDLGTDELNKLTLKDAVNHAINLSKNLDTYTINDLKTDFGIEIDDVIKGIDISELKSMGISEIGDGLQDVLSQITAAELGAELVDLSDMDSIFEKEISYYLKQSTNVLYKDSEYKEEVSKTDDFKYSVITESGRKYIKIKNYKQPVLGTGEVKIKLKNLPLVSSISTFTSNLGDNLTLKELYEDYGVELPSYIYDGNENAKINEIENIVDSIRIGEFLDVTIDDSNPNDIIVKDTSGYIITGVYRDIVLKTVNEIDDFEDIINTATAKDLEYFVDVSSFDSILNKTTTFYTNGFKLCEEIECVNEVTFDYSIVGNKVIINDIEHDIENYKVNVMFRNLPLIEAIDIFANNLGENITLYELKNDYGVELPDYIYNGNENAKINEVEGLIDTIYLGEFLGYSIDDSDAENIIVKDKNNGNKEVKGLMYDLAISKIADLENIEEKFENVSAVDLDGLMDLSSLTILNKTNTYYVHNSKLFKDPSHTTEVEFDYEIKNNSVYLDSQNFAISNNSVKITLKYLPITIAIEDFTSNLGSNLTLGDLSEDFGVVLPSYIIEGNESKKINEIESIIDNIYVGKILGYELTVVGNNVISVKDGANEVTGIMGIVAKKKVNELSDIQSEIENETIATLLDYKIENGKVYDRNNIEVTGVLAKVCKYSILNVDEVTEDLMLGDIFDDSRLNSGVFNLLGNDKANIKVTEVAAELTTAIQESSLLTLSSPNVNLITLDNDVKAKIQIAFDHDNDSSTEDIALGDMPLDVLLTYLIRSVPV